MIMKMMMIAVVLAVVLVVEPELATVLSWKLSRFWFGQHYNWRVECQSFVPSTRGLAEDSDGFVEAIIDLRGEEKERKDSVSKIPFFETFATSS